LWCDLAHRCGWPNFIDLLFVVGLFLVRAVRVEDAATIFSGVVHFAVEATNGQWVIWAYVFCHLFKMCTIFGSGIEFS
jgi:hypothetical protein